MFVVGDVLMLLLLLFIEYATFAHAHAHVRLQHGNINKTYNVVCILFLF